MKTLKNAPCGNISACGIISEERLVGMKKKVEVTIIALALVALILGGIMFLIRGIAFLILQTRHDELLIGESRAETVALTNAGFDESQVSGLASKLSYGSDGWCYKVSFKTLALEYTYKIEAYSGAILDKKTR